MSDFLKVERRIETFLPRGSRILVQKGRLFPTAEEANAADEEEAQRKPIGFVVSVRDANDACHDIALHEDAATALMELLQISFNQP